MRPLELVALNLDRPVTIQIKRNQRYLGTLAGYDDHLNLYLENVKSESIIISDDDPATDDDEDDVSKSGLEGHDDDEDHGAPSVKKVVEDMGNLILRGDNVIFMKFDKPNFGRPQKPMGRGDGGPGRRDGPPRRDGYKGQFRGDDRRGGPPPPRRDGPPRRPDDRRDRAPPRRN